jgi:predicted nucleic acid-binding protein
MKALFVADTSAVAALFLPDEASRTLREVFDSLGDVEILVPSLFWYEIANVVKRALAKGWLTEAEALSLWPHLTALRFRIDDRGGPGYGRELSQLAHSHGLSAYDASYFELAARKGAALISLDKTLRDVATGAGVPVMPSI